MYRPAESDSLRTVHDSGTGGADSILHEPRYRFTTATQPYREDRNTDAQLRNKHPGGLLHLPYLTGCRHHGIQSYNSACRRGSGAYAGADTRDRETLQLYIR